MKKPISEATRLLRTFFQAHRPIFQLLLLADSTRLWSTQALKDKNISYAVVQPRMTFVEGKKGNEYLTLFSQDKKSLTQLFEGEKLFLSYYGVHYGSKLMRLRTAIFKRLVQILATLKGKSIKEVIRRGNQLSVSVSSKRQMHATTTSPKGPGYEETDLEGHPRFWHQVKTKPTAALTTIATKELGQNYFYYEISVLVWSSFVLLLSNSVLASLGVLVVLSAYYFFNREAAIRNVMAPIFEIIPATEDLFQLEENDYFLRMHEFTNFQENEMRRERIDYMHIATMFGFAYGLIQYFSGYHSIFIIFILPLAGQVISHTAINILSGGKGDLVTSKLQLSSVELSQEETKKIDAILDQANTEALDQNNPVGVFIPTSNDWPNGKNEKDFSAYIQERARLKKFNIKTLPDSQKGQQGTTFIIEGKNSLLGKLFGRRKKKTKNDISINILSDDALKEFKTKRERAVTKVINESMDSVILAINRNQVEWQDDKTNISDDLGKWILNNLPNDWAYVVLLEESQTMAEHLKLLSHLYSEKGKLKDKSWNNLGLIGVRSADRSLVLFQKLLNSGNEYLKWLNPLSLYNYFKGRSADQSRFREALTKAESDTAKEKKLALDDVWGYAEKKGKLQGASHIDLGQNNCPFC